MLALISNILKNTIEGERFEGLLLRQLDCLSEKEFEHTGVGLFVYMKASKAIEPYRLSSSQLDLMFGGYNHQLTKFELINEGLNVQADVSIHFHGGLIDSVEIWNKLGDYPTEELMTYELKRLSNEGSAGGR